MSAPTPPGSPKPSRWASRMGAAVRRSSTLLSIARPTTPQTDRDSDTASLRKSTSREALPASAPKLNTTPAPTPTPPAVVTIPTPIAESPVREAEATQREVGPSPLIQTDVAPAPATQDPTSPAYVPPPLIDSTAGNPGAFTDILDTIPQPDVVKDPYAASNTGPSHAPTIAEEPEAAQEAKVEPEPEPVPVVVAEPEPIPAAEEPTPAPVAVEEAAPAPEPAVEHYSPPAVVEYAVGNPGAFVDEPQELPQPTVASPEPAPVVEAAADPEPVAEPEAAPVAPDRSLSYFDDKPMAESMSDYDPAEHAVEFAQAVQVIAPIVRSASPEPQREPEPAPEPVPEPQPRQALVPIVAVAAAAAAAAAIVAEKTEKRQETEPLPAYQTQGEAASYYNSGRPEPQAAVAQPEPLNQAPSTNGHAATNNNSGAMPQPFGATVMPDYGMDQYTSPDIWASAEHIQKPHNVWAAASEVPPQNDGPAAQENQYDGYTTTLPIAIPIPIRGEASVGNGNGSVHSVSPNFKMPNPHPDINENDPFADPITSTPAARLQVLPVGHDADQMVNVPLLAFNDVIPQPISQMPSQSSRGPGSMAMPVADVSYTENTPLLPRTPSPSGKTRRNYAAADARATVSPLASTSWNLHGVAHQPRLHELGWLEYHLPDGAVYYVHPTRRVTTDVDLRSDHILDAVEAWLADTRDESRNVGVEAWLRAQPGPVPRKGVWGSSKRAQPAVMLERYWVDHHERTVVKDDGVNQRVPGAMRGYIRGAGGNGKGKKASGAPQVQEEQLDLEFRFWSFMEAHPAHNVLPHKAKAEAMDVLTWSWTDRLLPSARPIPAPFSQEECQELITLLRSFHGERPDDHGIQTRVVSRILLRVALWRQMYFRPNKPLPKDAGSSLNELPVYRRPFRRALFDFIVSCLCLGIPFLFLERARLSTRADHESGIMRSNPMIITGVCTCLVAAMVLSASVTFLSLPGLDNVALTSGMIAVVFAAFSLISTAVAILKHKTDLSRPISHMGVDGLMAISRRTVAMSLPAVFLAYALIGLVTGIVLYSFRGGHATDPGSPKGSFADYVRWVIVGVVGALAGVVTTSLIVMRR